MIFDELVQRGLVKQTTNTEKIRDLLNNQKVTFYIGFDPTANSLHVGHLLQLVTARRLVRAGHRAILLIGDATAAIGDPTGKSEMRKMLSEREIGSNALDIEDQLKKLVPGAFVITNGTWFKHSTNMSFLEALREFGPHFSVNNMLRADSVKSRMENGLSFLEFSYMLLQAIDFFKLTDFLNINCQLQIGGDDQWSNILAGIDLVHKKKGQEVFGLTLPLLTNSAGQKMGKTERGTVWLDANKTSPFEFFQFWRNIPDDKVQECTNFFTDEFPNSLIESSFDINHHKKKLAFEVTKLVHGEEAAAQALKQAEALFRDQDASVMEATPIADSVHVLDLMMRCGFARSRTDARNLINGRGVSINNEVLTDPTIIVTKEKFGNELVVRKGKKHFCRLLIEDKCQDPNS